MNTLSKYLVIACFIFANTLSAQVEILTTEYKRAAILEVSRLLNDFYIFPDVAKKNEVELQKQLTSGFYDSYTTYKSFSDALTEQLQLFTKDKHLIVRPILAKEAVEHTMERMLEDHLGRLEYDDSNHGGFNEVKILEGNVGYLDLRNFAQPVEGFKYADSYMQLLSTTDAVIIDLSQNGGGIPGMVQYLCSYFFEKEVHLNSLYFREGDRTLDFWTIDVNGKKMPDVPLFVITSENTFSGAEEFSYNMQNQNRATLVGQTTRGGANPGRLIPLNNNIEAFVPNGRAINPVTRTNWEGVGVIPEVETTAEEAFDMAHDLAKKAAEEYSNQKEETNKQLVNDLLKELDSFNNVSSEEKIYTIVKNCRENGILEEGIINSIGYDYLMKYKKSDVAEAIFRANTMLFPESANVYDSYAETLANNNKLKEAADNYQKAIDIAKATSNRDLDYYQNNLKNIKERM